MTTVTPTETKESQVATPDITAPGSIGDLTIGKAGIAAAKSLKDAYENLTAPAKGKDRLIKVTHTAKEEGHGQFIISGPKKAINAFFQALTAAPSIPEYLNLSGRILIHSSDVATEDGPTTEKEEDQTKKVTINHVFTTY